MKMHPPVSLPDLTGHEEAYVVDAIRSSWISSTGAYVNRFEKEWAARCEAEWAVSVCNGTAALHLAMLLKDVKPGDEVIVPSLTFVATAAAVRYCGATPVFVDVEPHHWCIDPAAVEQALTSRTVGIIAVHLYGHPADMDRLSELAELHGLWVVEDAAEAHLARYKDKPVGSLAGLGTFSFYGNKIITSGEGGAVVGHGPGVSKIRMLRGQGMDPERRYFHEVIGYNYRLTNVACAILCAQLERAQTLLDSRRRVVERYRAALGSSSVSFQDSAPWAEPAPWMTGILLTSEDRRVRVAKALAEEGVETRPFFVPIHTMPPYATPRSVLPVTDHLARVGLCLPTYPTLSNESIDRISECVLRANRA